MNATPELFLADSPDEGDIVDTNRLQQLAGFLRARRESLDPARLGLPRIGRRRTPGLRREEVAQLAGIGITWYTKLEQGRPIRVSAKVLDAVAAALQCSETETRHLFTLAGVTRPASVTTKPSCERLSEAWQRVLDQMNPFPAVIQSARFDIIGFNAGYCRLVGIDLATIPPEDRNCLYLALTHPTWRACLGDCDEALDRMVALFRAAMAEHMQDPAWERQLQRYMNVSAEFRELWPRHQVVGIENHVKRFRHASVGVYSMQQTNWWSAAQNGVRMLVYMPADEESERLWRQLSAL
ncbi:helix-turn-helix transcriptional regulator [Paraburkholderia kururiensis]|uniref:helix-turn-helix transcriptional regulator n=1 Tax=Paraburkholderia kururiensis TaxID=984307 RepID=UPI00034C0D5F|nr:helix-turn-helix transcriptional regulator [Paraburkholderia kururiensis]